MRGNTRTRDYVIRREFDIAEGDAYNRVLVDRAERRLKNLGFFKTVKIGTEPGSSADRVVLNVDVEEQSTGEFSVAGGYSTADGIVAEVSVGERNLMGRGQTARASVTYGQRTRGVDLSFGEPYFLDLLVMNPSRSASKLKPVMSSICSAVWEPPWNASTRGACPAARRTGTWIK